jgi:hypothetical protein
MSQSKSDGNGVQPCVPHHGDRPWVTVARGRPLRQLQGERLRVRYSKEGARRVNKPGSACARCRAAPAHLRCSISKRRGSKAVMTELVALSHGFIPRPVQYRVSKPAIPGAPYTMNARTLGALEPFCHSSPVQTGHSSTDDWPRVPPDMRRLLHPPTVPKQ